MIWSWKLRCRRKSRSLKHISHPQQRAIILHFGLAGDTKGPGRSWIWWSFQLAVRFRIRHIPDFEALLARKDYQGMIAIIGNATTAW
ncbi:MAG: hypothetical protein KC900_14450 [Candidatus Omnitrophica bacterium]|nr:hypothetical protein [Candidatus Omnitrophota bacterium]